MVAGWNLRVEVIRREKQADDAIGGAVYQNVVVYEQLRASLSANRPTQASLEQGLETNAVYDFTCQANYRRENVTICERDVLRVVWPVSSPLYGLKLRVTGVQLPRSRTKYAPLHATTVRVRDSRNEDKR